MVEFTWNIIQFSSLQLQTRLLVLNKLEIAKSKAGTFITLSSEIFFKNFTYWNVHEWSENIKFQRSYYASIYSGWLQYSSQYSCKVLSFIGVTLSDSDCRSRVWAKNRELKDLTLICWDNEVIKIKLNLLFDKFSETWKYQIGIFHLT